MVFLMDSERTGKRHINQKQSMLSLPTYRRLKVKLLSIFMTHASKIVWVLLTLDFFLPSLKIDSIVRMNGKRKDSYESNSVFCVFWVIAIVALQGRLSLKVSVRNVGVCACVCIDIPFYIFKKNWGTVWKLDLIYLNLQVLHSASITLIKRKSRIKYVTPGSWIWQQRRKLWFGEASYKNMWKYKSAHLVWRHIHLNICFHIYIIVICLKTLVFFLIHS